MANHYSPAPKVRVSDLPQSGGFSLAGTFAQIELSNPHDLPFTCKDTKKTK